MKSDYYLKTLDGVTYRRVEYDGRIAGIKEMEEDAFFTSLSQGHKDLLAKLKLETLETRVEIR